MGFSLPPQDGYIWRHMDLWKHTLPHEERSTNNKQNKRKIFSCICMETKAMDTNENFIMTTFSTNCKIEGWSMNSTMVTI